MAEKTTEETTGGKYLTKDYLARNLKTFWDKIKDYITTQISGFAKTKDVNEALDGKADKTALEALTTEVNGKANISDLNNLVSTVETKVDQDALTAVKNGLQDKVNTVEGMGLSTNDFTQEYKNKLDELEDATETKAGLMSAQDKVKLANIAEGATAVTVDSVWDSTSENPAQSKAISGVLDKKVDKENLQNPLELIDFEAIKCSVTNNGKVILMFGDPVKYVKIYTTDNDKPIEKVLVKDSSTTLFTNFQAANNGYWSLTLESLNNFYIECLIYDNKKYKPFIMEISYDSLNDMYTPRIKAVFES